MSRYLNSKGDTIIEVVLSMALLTSILFTAWSITNRASQISLAATERTKMVNLVKQQAEIAKAEWAKPGNQSIFTNNTTFPETPSGATFNPNPCDDLTSSSPKWYFTVNTSTNTVTSTSFTYVAINTENVWIQKVKDPSTPSTYTDLYVRACWFNGSGGYQKSENSQVIVRLNS